MVDTCQEKNILPAPFLRVLKRLCLLSSSSLSEAGPSVTTVDQSDIRGLVTA